MIYLTVKTFGHNNTQLSLNRLNGWLNTKFKLSDFTNSYEDTRKIIIEKIVEMEADSQQFELIDSAVDTINKGRGLPFYSVFEKNKIHSMFN